MDNSRKGPWKAGNGSVGYAKKHQDLIDGIVRNLKFLDEDGSILTAGNSGKVPPGQIKGGGAGGDGGEKFQYFLPPRPFGINELYHKSFRHYRGQSIYGMHKKNC